MPILFDVRMTYEEVSPEDAAEVEQVWHLDRQEAVFEGTGGTLYHVVSTLEHGFRHLIAKGPNLTYTDCLPEWPWEPTVELTYLAEDPLFYEPE